MGLIRSADQLQVPDVLVGAIFGQAGIGKTSLALTMPKPLLLDFDKGIHRVQPQSIGQAGIVQLANWGEANSVLKEDLSSYESIIIDTGGKMIDFIVEKVTYGKQPQIQHWGIVNQEFKMYVSKLRNLNKHIIFVFHRDTRKEGEKFVFVPALREKSYNAIISELDVLGYMKSENIRGNDIRTITFEPTAKNDGKNTLGLHPLIEVPELNNLDGYLGRILVNAHMERVNKSKESTAKYNELVDEIREQIELITDDVSANDFVLRTKEFTHIGTSKALMADLFKKKIKTVPVQWNAELKKYEPKS